MARYCKQCEKKLGFFEQDYNGICEECFEKNQKQMELRRKEEFKKRQEEIRQQEEIRRKEKDEREKSVRIEQQKEQEKKKELLKNKLIVNPMILDRLNNMINMIPTGMYGEINKTKSHFSQNGFLSEILFELLIWIYCKMPDEFTLKDIDSINNYESLVESRLDLKEFFKENIHKSYLEIDNYNKKVCDYNNSEEFLFANSNIYVFHELQMKEDTQWSDYYSVDDMDYMSEQEYLKVRNISKNMCMLVYFKEIYSYAITVFYGIVFSKNMEVIRNNEELNKIYSNLVNSTEDMKYIANKLYEMYKNFYTDLFEMKMYPNSFYNLVYLFKWKESYEYKYLKDDEYEEICNKLENEDKENKIQIIIDKIKDSNCISDIEQLGNDKVSACKILLIDTITRVEKYLTYDDMFLYLKDLYKNANELAEFANKQIAIKEKERLLNGDMNKEVEKEELEVDYSNVQNGYDFEEYIANLYKKLGYKIEEVTKKSGDQGADVIAYKDDVKYVIQVKFYNNPVGNKAVQEVVGAIGMYKADKGIVVTNSTFTPQAIELANANNVELVDKEKLEEYKKGIIDNVTPINSNYDDEFMKNVINLWSVSIEDIQIAGNPNCIEDLFFKFGMILRAMDNENFYKENNVDKFLELIHRYSYFDENLDTFMSMGFDNVIELYIRAGIFQAFLLGELEKASKIEEANISDVDKIMIIYINNVEEVGTPEQVLALSKTFNWSDDETINNILEYKEKLAD